MGMRLPTERQCHGHALRPRDEMPACGEMVAPPGDAQRRSPICQFYSGATVLLTGGTGFMGKVLLQKLLRSCPDLEFIHLIIRTKKGKDPESRLDELFDRMKEEVPKWRHKVRAVPGDCAEPGLGLSAADREMLARDVTVLFHGAATVRFDEKLKKAVSINVVGTKQILELARQMPKLKAMAHISTAYSHCPIHEIKEQFYDTPISHEKVMEMADTLDDDTLDQITTKLLDKYPNTYVFTKALAEEVIKKECRDLPLVVFRPAIVVSTRDDPVPGWIDNFYGPTGVGFGAGVGLLKTLHCDGQAVANIVPVDMAVNALIAATWDVACNPNVHDNLKNNNNNKEEKDASCVPIYNYVSCCDMPLTWNEFKEMNEKYGIPVPTVHCIWYYSFRLCNNRYIYLLQALFLHWLPALLMDSILFVSRNKPKMIKAYQKIHRFSNVITYFSTQHWDFTNQNVIELWDRLSKEDKKMFDFDMKKLDWDKFFTNYILGCRIYILKDDISTLPQARIRWRRFYWAHQIVKLAFTILLLSLTWQVISFGKDLLLT
ncbi:Fatty acyl-CoA reductase wat [Gryllus bimaculatus]|nr:Fatty acyl-CoA reductase wat [Gryllus bimaculatus]